MFRVKSSSVRPRSRVVMVCPADDKQLGRSSPEVECTSEDVFVFCYDTSALYRAVRPLVWSMWLTGTYFERQPSSEAWAEMEEELRPVDITSRSRRRRYPFSMVYSACIMAVLWLNLLRTCSGLAMEAAIGPNMFLRILLIAWTGLCTVNFTAMFRGSLSTSSGLTGFFMRWRRFQSAEYGRLDMGYARKHSMLYVGACWGCIVVQVGAIGYGLYHMHLMHITMTPFSEDDPWLDVYRAVYVVVHFYLSAAWTLPVAMEIFLSVVLSNEYARCNEALSGTIDKNNRMTSCLETYRVWHHRLCALTSNVDNIVGLQTGGMLATCMVEVCIILYSMIWYQEIRTTLVLLACFIFWLFTATGKLALIAIGGVIVNDAAHGSYDLLHSLDLVGITQNEALHLTVFLNRLSSNSIGLTALKLFVIDKPTILTIVGMLITYFVLIVQFSPPDDGKASGMNCTELLLNATLHCYAGQTKGV